MSLTPVTAESVDAYVAFMREHGDEETRKFMERDDTRERIVKSGRAYLLESAGKLQAILSAVESPGRDGVTRDVTVHIVTEAGTDAEFAHALSTLLYFKALDPVVAPRRYAMTDTPFSPLPLDILKRFGFIQTTSRSKYQRDAGPAGPDEFPLAEKARALGYVTERITRVSLDDDPTLAERMAEIYNLAFVGRAGVGRRDADDMRKRLATPDTDIVIVRRGETVAGFTTLIELEDEVLGADIAVARSHWGTGAADLLCRRFVDEVHALYGKKIAAYADTTNKASTRMLERAGLRPVESYLVWELLVPARENQPTEKTASIGSISENNNEGCFLYA